MDFEVGLIFIIGYLLSLSKSQARFHVYYSAPGQEYQRFYSLSGNQWTEFLKGKQTVTYPPYRISKSAFWYPKQHSVLHHSPKQQIQRLNTDQDRLIFQKNTPIYGPPKELNFRGLNNFNPKFFPRTTGNDVTQKNKDFYKYGSIYFEEYPHLKSLLKHQTTRKDNKLRPLKLGSLRTDSPYFRF